MEGEYTKVNRIDVNTNMGNGKKKGTSGNMCGIHNGAKLPLQCLCSAHIHCIQTIEVGIYRVDIQCVKLEAPIQSLVL